MNVMQSLADFKQNLHCQAQASTKSGDPRKTAEPASAAQGLAAKSAPAPGVRASGNAAAAAPATAATGGSGSTTITANDFLQLLVAEMKNQDPTATRDPNAYIDQLVQVNSLQQLIAINQDLNPKAASSSGSIARGPAGGGISAVAAAGKLGSAAGGPAAAVAASLAPRPAQPGPPPDSLPNAANGAAAFGAGNTAPGPSVPNSATARFSPRR